MNNEFWNFLEKNPAIGLSLNFIVLIVIPTVFIIFLVRNIKKRNKVGIIVFSFLNLCCLLFILYSFFSIFLLINTQKKYNQQFSQEVEQVHFYTVEEIDNNLIDNVKQNSNSFPIIKLNKGITIGGESDKSFVFYNKIDYKIAGFVFYLSGFEVPVTYDFIPGHCYSINFEKISKEYVLKDVGVFYSKNGNEKTELWTDEQENGIYCLFTED